MAAVVSPTLERIIRDVRVLLNQPKQENSRWSDAELATYANDAVQQIFATVNEYSEGQFDKTANLNIVNAVETVALPTDCFAVRGLWKVQGTINRRLEYRQNITEDYGNSSSTNGQSNYEPYYYLRGNNIVLRPIPGFSETSGLVIEYTAYPSVLVMGSDTMDAGISPIFKEMIEMYVITKAKLKDDLVAGGNTRLPAEERLTTLFLNFKHQVSERAKAPQYITPYEPI